MRPCVPRRQRARVFAHGVHPNDVTAPSMGVEQPADVTPTPVQDPTPSTSFASPSAGTGQATTTQPTTIQPTITQWYDLRKRHLPTFLY